MANENKDWVALPRICVNCKSCATPLALGWKAKQLTLDVDTEIALTFRLAVCLCVF